MITVGPLNANPGRVVSVNDGFVATGDDVLFYRENGEGRLVLFIHAGVADSRMWIPQIEAVPEGFHFVAFDQRGFGRSPVGSGPYADHLDALVILDHCSADSAVVVGCSIGASTALQVAIDAPDRVAGLVLIGANSPGVEPPDGYYEPPQWPKAIEAFEAGDLETVAQLDAEMWVAGNGREIGDIDPSVVELVLDMDRIALEHEESRDEVRQPGPDKVAGIGLIDLPTLVVVGEFDLPDEQMWADDLANKLSTRDAVVIANAAHLAGLEQPEGFNSAFFEFLESFAL